MLNSGDVVAVDFGSPIGGEAGFRHPAVVVTAQRLLDASPSVVQVVPLTSTVRAFASEVEIDADPSNGLDHKSSAQCQHVRAVAAGRHTDPRGNVGAAALTQIREVLGLIFDMPG
ncbi:MAG TPA: type II toxin-antitoxin system PemK/MazF family toxin [Actinomycetales bacterium]|nr:type II toxin-antitoxin system PemK/MazF family toxin [Actinomycetales bacterium]